MNLEGDIGYLDVYVHIYLVYSFYFSHIHGFAIKPGDILHVYEAISDYRVVKDGERRVPR